MSKERMEFECVDCLNSIFDLVEVDSAPSWATLTRRCLSCARKYPDSLLKATHDEFDYALGLKGGDVFRFRSAVLMGKWVHLNDVTEWDHIEVADGAFSLDRGIEVRLSEISWCCDAPRGS